MANTVQIKRGNTASVSSYTGPSGEVIYNTDTNRLHSQDGSVAGGHPHALMSDVNNKANSSVTISAGAGLTGGGNLTANRTINVGEGSGISVTADAVALSAASIASLAKADTALQAPGGSSGQILAKNSNTTNDVVWVSSEAATAVSYGPQTLNAAQQVQARQNIQADKSYDSIASVAASIVPSYANAIRTNGYYAAGDGGAALYTKVASEPTHAGKVQSADGAWWEIVIPVIGISVLSFGAKGDGVTDDTAAIQGAINALPARGGIIYLPSGRYIISSTINVGNGNGGISPSTKNAVKLIGDGIGYAVSGTLVPTIISWYGPDNDNPMISYNGMISDCDLKGVYLECRGLSSGISMMSFSGFDFDGVKIVAPKSIGISIIGGGAPVGNYNIFNSFKRISCALTIPNSIGLYMDGDYSVQNDTWLSKFELCRFEAITGATSAVCGWLKFVDSISFYRCHFVDYEPTATGLIFDALSNHNFPSGIDFISCSIKNTIVYEDETHKIRTNYFINHGTADNEVIPNHPKLVGITDLGLNFGAMGYNPGTGGSVAQETSKSTSVTLNRTNGRIIMNASPLAAGGLANFVFSNSFLTTSDVLILNITGGGGYGNYTVNVSDVQGGLAVISLRNVSSNSLSEPVEIGFAIIKANNS